jgi:hypothetical protein
MPFVIGALWLGALFCFQLYIGILRESCSYKSSRYVFLLVLMLLQTIMISALFCTLLGMEVKSQLPGKFFPTILCLFE